MPLCHSTQVFIEYSTLEIGQFKERHIETVQNMTLLSEQERSLFHGRFCCDILLLLERMDKHAVKLVDD